MPGNPFDVVRDSFGLPLGDGRIGADPGAELPLLGTVVGTRSEGLVHGFTGVAQGPPDHGTGADGNLIERQRLGSGELIGDPGVARGVAQDASGSARELALAYGRAIGCGRAGLIESSFAEECEADLFNEQAVVWGAVPAILEAGFETLVEAGFAPEVAFLECVGELKLLAELVEARGLAGMREAISNTAELGAVLGGPRIVDDDVRQKMRDILAEIRAGRFSRQLAREAAADYPLLRDARATARRSAVETARRDLDAT